MAKIAPGSKWLLRKKDWRSYVATASKDSLQVSICDPGGSRYGFVISRRDARLLAKCLNECLDRTR